MNLLKQGNNLPVVDEISSIVGLEILLGEVTGELF